MTLDPYDRRGAVPPDVQAMLDDTKKTVERARQLIRETDANLRTRADWHDPPPARGMTIAHSKRSSRVFRTDFFARFFAHCRLSCQLYHCPK